METEKQKKNMIDEFRTKLSSLEEKLNQRLESAMNDFSESNEEDQQDELMETLFMNEYKELNEDFARFLSWMKSEILNFSLLKKRSWKCIEDGEQAFLFKEKLKDFRNVLNNHREFITKTRIELTQANMKTNDDVISQEIRDRLERSSKTLDLLDEMSSKKAKTVPRKISL